jgi:hypothetical protein
MRRRARKSSAKWLSIEAVNAERNVVGSNAKEIAVKSTVKPTVLPAAMPVVLLISHAWITYDLNSRHVLILVSTGQ